MSALDDWKQHVITLTSALIETTAQSRSYDSALHCISYESSQNSIWYREGILFRLWRDAIWAYIFDQLNQYTDPLAPFPDSATVMSGVPTINWN